MLKDAEQFLGRNEAGVSQPPQNIEPKSNKLNPTPPQIFVDYDGVLSRQLDWQDRVLDEFARRANLESRIIIKRGDNRPEVNYTVVGETLAWRRFANPLDFFALLLRRRKDVETVANSQIAKAEIRVHDQVIAEEIGNQAGRFSNEQFVDRLNLAVKYGLTAINKWEKSQELKLTLAIDGLLTATTGIAAGLGYTGIILTLEGLRRSSEQFRSAYERTVALFQNQPVATRRLDDFTSIYESTIASLFLIFGPSAISMALILGIHESILVKGSKLRLNHLNPLKPIWDWAKGTMYLKFGPKEVVKLNQDQ